MIRIIGSTSILNAKKVGSKASSLNYLKRNGLPVPDGIILENEYFTSDKKEEFMSLLDSNKLYAVRSSALDEDGANYSFAGIQDTYLNVKYDDILDKVEECYKSQFNERAIEYRKTFGIGESRGMTVIVQEMVDANFAGVIFTQNPMNNRIDQVVIEVVEGLGEKLVSGYYTPSTYTINKNDLTDFEFKHHGVSLDIKTIKELVNYSNLIEHMYEIPQDIEFAVKEDKIYILQARPITTITYVPKQQKEGLRFYMSFAHIQNMTYPITPVGAEMIQKMFSVENSEFARGRILYNGEYLFLDISEFLLTPNFIYKNLIEILRIINFNLPELANQYRELNRTRKFLPRELLLVQLKILKRIIHILINNQVSNDFALEFMKVHALRFSEYNDAELIANQNKIAMPLFKEILPYIINGMISFFRLQKLFDKWNLDRSDFNKLVSGLDGNITVEMGLLYDDMLLHYGTDKGEKIFDEYIKKFGMRVDGEIDIGRNRPIDNLEKFKIDINKMVLTHNGESLRYKHYKQIIEANKVVHRLEKKLSKRQFKKLNYWLKRLRNYYILREHPKHTIIKIFEKYREKINTPFETFEEKLNGGCDLKIIEERKARYEAANDKLIPIAMLSNGLILKPEKVCCNGYIQGFGVSAGKVTALVRVIEDINDDVLQAGEILVTKFTDPGWTRILAKAGGIITEVGGMMTHGAIVAREYGIPAVVGIENAVNMFKTGDRITIDGDNGIIVVENKE